MTHQKRNSDLSRRALIRAAGALPALGLVSACGSLVPGQGPPPDLYRLTPKFEFPGDLPTVDWQLLVSEPTAPASLDDTRVALLHNPIRIEYYARANWVDRVPVLLQTAVIAGFEQSGKILSIGRDTTDMRPDYILNMEIRDFQADYIDSPTPIVHVGLVGRLVSARKRAILAAKQFEGAQHASADTVQGVVEAFNVTVGKVVSDIVAWTLPTGDADRKSA
jgi:cholesterol transport system auxiliary component